MILDNYKQFIEEIYARLYDLGIDTEQLRIDHIAYQTDSTEDYEEQIKNIKNIAESSDVKDVGRNVAIIKLNSLLAYQNNIFRVIEIIEPLPGEKVKSAWEHVEFLVNGTLENFMEQHPDINWNTSKLNRKEFPMLVLDLGDGLKAKFPRLSVLEERKKQEARSNS